MTTSSEHKAKADDVLRNRKRAYQLAVANPAVQEMLHDLSTFCRAHLTPAPELEGQPVDVNRAMVMFGRQQVFDRIQRHLHLSVDQLFSIYSGRRFQVTEDEDDA